MDTGTGLKKQQKSRETGFRKGKKPNTSFSAAPSRERQQKTRQRLSAVVEGIFTVQRSGAAFVVPLFKAHSAEKNTRDHTGDVRILPGMEGGAWHGDTVRAERLNPSSRDGAVAEVLVRAHRELAVVVREKSAGSSCLCEPVDMRFPFTLWVETKNLPHPPEEGELLVVKPFFPSENDPDGPAGLNGQDSPDTPDRPSRPGTLGRRKDKNNPRGPQDAHATRRFSRYPRHYFAEAIKTMGQEDSAPVQEAFAKFNNDIPTFFPDDVLEEVAALEQSGGREAVSPHRPLLDFPFVTIDGPDSKDFDDAIFVRRENAEGEADSHGERFRLLVAIADVSAWVMPFSALDKEAYRRGNSYYFPSSVEPMLPPLLSDDICSLRPLVSRAVMYADMVFNAKGHVIEGEGSFGCGSIVSAARLTYETVQAFYDTPEAKPPFGPDVALMLMDAKDLASLLIDRRKKEGGLDFAMPEPVFSIDDKGHVTGVADHAALFSHKLIEAFMVAANEAVAVFLEKKKLPFLYRAHPDPSQEKVMALKEALGEMGLELPSLKKNKQKQMGELPKEEENTISPQGLAAFYSALLDSVQGSPQEFVVDRLALRSLMQARYSPIKEGHFGLASQSYCHFTSPIRRYADLVNHRVLKKALALPGGYVETEKKLLKVAEMVNATERLATQTEREVARRLACLYFLGKEGEEWPAVISSVTSFGFFAELVGLPVEVLVRLENLGADYFIFMPERHELVGELSGQVYRMGQSLRLSIRRVDLRRLDIEAMPTGAGGEDILFGKKRGAYSHKPARSQRRYGGENAGRQTARYTKKSDTPPYKDRGKTEKIAPVRKKRKTP